MQNDEIQKARRIPFLKKLFTNNRTYDELKFYPGDHLNILTGPNGTGKSSIVAAIILGCGGEPALLSRSKSVSYLRVISTLE